MIASIKRRQGRGGYQGNPAKPRRKFWFTSGNRAGDINSTLMGGFAKKENDRISGVPQLIERVGLCQ